VGGGGGGGGKSRERLETIEKLCTMAFAHQSYSYSFPETTHGSSACNFIITVILRVKFEGQALLSGRVYDYSYITIEDNTSGDIPSKITLVVIIRTFFIQY